LTGFSRHYFGIAEKTNATTGNRRQREEENNMRQKSISYWVITAMVAFFIGSGGAAELAQVPGNI